MKLAINMLNGKPEIFQSIQGEGRNSGLDCIFIRLKGCNLSCSWCDTKDSWQAGHPQNEGVCYRAPNEIYQLLRQYPIKHLVITGGEPLLQQRGISELLSFLDGYYIELETNGTILPTTFFNQINVSPKLKHAGNPASNYEQVKALTALAKMPNADFKFVMKDEQNIHSVVDFVDKFQISKDRVFLMPLGQTIQELEQREAVVRKLCSVHGFNFTDRIHIKRYAGRRGV